VSEWGPRIKRLIEIEQATGRTPQALQDAPICYGYEREMVLAFNFLTDRRSIGMVANPIPLTEIEAYFNLLGDQVVPKDIFLELMRVMDLEYLEKANRGH
jgi:hypothetical protein